MAKAVLSFVFALLFFAYIKDVLQSCALCVSGLWCKAGGGEHLCTARLCHTDPPHITCYRLYDVLELGVERYQGIKDFTQAAKLVQLGNKVTTCELQAAVLHS